MKDEKNQGFKVNDRRLKFDDSAEEQPVEETKVEPPATAKVKEEAKPEPAVPKSEPVPPPPTKEDHKHDHDHGNEEHLHGLGAEMGPIDFRQFVLSLAT